jgi:hypothetical protein
MPNHDRKIIVQPAGAAFLVVLYNAIYREEGVYADGRPLINHDRLVRACICIRAGLFDRLPCNAFVWCGDVECFEPDAHRHTLHDCWLKFTEAPAVPEVNMRGRFPSEYRSRHPNAPAEVQWRAGVLLPRGVRLTNGTWSVRWQW